MCHSVSRRLECGGRGGSGFTTGSIATFLASQAVLASHFGSIHDRQPLPTASIAFPLRGY